jgi:hypothetical protein
LHTQILKITCTLDGQTKRVASIYHFSPGIVIIEEQKQTSAIPRLSSFCRQLGTVLYMRNPASEPGLLLLMEKMQGHTAYSVCDVKAESHCINHLHVQLSKLWPTLRALVTETSLISCTSETFVPHCGCANTSFVSGIDRNKEMDSSRRVLSAQLCVTMCESLCVGGCVRMCVAFECVCFCASALLFFVCVCVLLWRVSVRCHLFEE